VLGELHRVTGMVSIGPIRLRVGPSGAGKSLFTREKIRFVLLEKRPDEVTFSRPGESGPLRYGQRRSAQRAVVEPKITIRTDYGQMPRLFWGDERTEGYRTGQRTS